MSRPFKIKEVKLKIFLFEFKNNYDLCMYFLRYQEFYESPSSKFRGKSFTIFDFMKWYSLKYGNGAFTYPNDWDGFNLPSKIIYDVWNQRLIPDRNFYDFEMYSAWKECYEITQGPFYIIGIVKGNTALSHEIAHALFYLNQEYKKEMKKLVSGLTPTIKKEIGTTLKRLGYASKVYIDEAQAYLSTGLTVSFGDPARWPKERKLFEDVFKKFTEKTK